MASSNTEFLYAMGMPSRSPFLSRSAKSTPHVSIPTESKPPNLVEASLIESFIFSKSPLCPNISYDLFSPGNWEIC